METTNLANQLKWLEALEGKPGARYYGTVTHKAKAARRAANRVARASRKANR